jgi:hypothetical protein
MGAGHRSAKASYLALGSVLAPHLGYGGYYRALAGGATISGDQAVRPILEKLRLPALRFLRLAATIVVAVPRRSMRELEQHTARGENTFTRPTKSSLSSNVASRTAPKPRAVRHP